MLGIGLDFKSPALSGAGGGVWTPNSITNPVGIYDFFDNTSLFRMDSFTSSSGTARVRWNTTGYWEDFTSSTVITVAADKSVLMDTHGITYDTFENMCTAYGGEQSIPLNTTTGWTLGTGWSINTSTQKLESDGTTTSSVAYYNLGSYIENDTWYRLSFRLSATSGDYFGVSIGDLGNSLAQDANIGGPVTDGYVNMMLYSAGVNEIEFGSGLIALLGDVWDIKIQKVPGNHMYFPTEPGYAETVGGVGYLTAQLNSYGYTFQNVTLPTELMHVTMADPSDANQPTASGSMTGIRSATGQRAGHNNGSGLADIWEPGLFIETTSGVEWVYQPGVDDTALKMYEFYVNSTTNAYEFWLGNSSVASGTTTGNINLDATSTGQMVVLTTPNASVPTAQEGTHDIYAYYVYGGGRDTNVYTHIDDNTGNQL